ncbi:DUF916 and DUF3324 domain-containing protein [Enterococcus sp. LJL128]|uniref:DUF916 and DUF3324 domain-containing protein n=1 Tax=Enterococcus sp. LJL51 TaxID=3416656 RepID=UPI003CE862D5
MKKQATLITIVFLLVALVLTSLTAEAAENEIDYSISADLPENQRAGNSTYFDLLVSPGQEQELTVNIFNSSDKEQIFLLEANTATTNNNGIIDYTQPDAKQDLDETLSFYFSDLITHDKTITVPPNSNKKASFKLKVPKQPFKGMLLGGLHIKQEAPELVEGQINNTYSYVLGVVLRENEEQVKPQLKLKEITPDLKNYRPHVAATLQNTQPINIQDLDIKAVIREKGSSEPLRKSEKQGISMAPNSNFDYSISWEDQPLNPGMYELELTAEDQDSNRWHFKKEFTISEEKAGTLNQSALGLNSSEKDQNPLYFWLALFLIVSAASIYFWRRQRAIRLEQEFLKQQRKKVKKTRKKKSSVEKV